MMIFFAPMYIMVFRHGLGSVEHLLLEGNVHHKRQRRGQALG